MNKLMKQVYQPDQVRGRESRIRVDPGRQMIAYKAPNSMVFFIDTKPLDVGGEAIVTNDHAELYSASHKTHTLGSGRVCLAGSLRGWDLTQILFQCDSWARGYEIYQRTGKFPEDPIEAFSRTKRNRKRDDIFEQLRQLGAFISQ